MLHRVPFGERPGAAERDGRVRGARQCLDAQPRRFTQFAQAGAHRSRHLRHVPARHRQAALAEHEPPVRQAQARQAAGAHRDAPGIEQRHGLAFHVFRVGVGRRVVGFISALDRVHDEAAQSGDTAHVHGRTHQVGQVQLRGQRGREQFVVGDEAVFEQRAFEHLGQREPARQHLVQRVAQHRRREFLADREQQLRGDLGGVGVERQFDLGAEREVLGADCADLDHVFAQVALRLDRRAHRLEHWVALGLGVHRVHELDAHPAQAAQRHLHERRVRRRSGAQRAGGQVGEQCHVAHGLDPGVLHAVHVDQRLAPVELGAGAVRQDRARRMELRGGLRCVVGLARQQVGDGQGVAVGDVGERVAQQLERGDAGVVGVVVGPERA